MNDTIVPSGETVPHGIAGPSGHGNGGRDDSHQKKTNIRKRTKTGCLTCRKRRIKCDEGRPTCNNCVKSKRHCEGYNQRVIFKDPFRAGPHPLHGPYESMVYYGTGHPFNQFATLHGRPSGHGALPNLAPKPPTLEYMLPPNGQQYTPQYHLPPGQLRFQSFSPGSNVCSQSPYDLSLNPQAQTFVPAFEQNDQHLQTGTPSLSNHQSLELVLQSRDQTNYDDIDAYANRSLHIGYHRSSMMPLQESTMSEDEDDDAWLGDSDDDYENSVALVAPIINRLYTPGPKGSSMRSFGAFVDINAISEYMNYPDISALRNEAKRHIFEHFMKVTGPSMSLFERHPFDASEQEVADYTPGSGSNIWSFTFPIISFQHPGLLHAMLASASLQLANLQGAPPTAAMKHYHLAIRRIAKNVRTPLRRTHPATLAATLLLGYFEVWNGDHNMWCNHLYGARILFAEMPLRAMSQRCLPAKSLKERHLLMRRMGIVGTGASLPADSNILDFELLSVITGHHTHAADYGLTEVQVVSSDHSATTDRDISDYENLRDLFWWYCKMDVYQGILGATPLFMKYENWSQCPPRAPTSRLDRIYGTYDHLMLLLGRVVTFATRDLPRKRRANPFASSKSSSPPGFPGMIPTSGDFRVPMGFSPPTKRDPDPDPTEGLDPEVARQMAVKEWEAICDAFAIFENNLGAEFRPLGSEYADRRDYPFGPALQYRTFSVAGIWMNYYMGLIHLHRNHPNLPAVAMPCVKMAAARTTSYANNIGRISIGLAEEFDNISDISTVMAAALIESAFCLFVAAVQFQDDAQRRWVVTRMLDITRLTGWRSAKQIAEGCEASWSKFAELGQGPPYTRIVMPPVPPEIVWHRIRRIDRRIQEVDEGGEGAEEKRVVLASSERAYYALGLLGIEDDMSILDLKDHAFSRRS